MALRCLAWRRREARMPFSLFLFSPFAHLIVPSIPIVGRPKNLSINASALAAIVNYIFACRFRSVRIAFWWPCLAVGLHLSYRCLSGGKSTNFFGFGFVRVCSGVRVCFGDDAALLLIGGALRRWGWWGFVAARGSLCSSDFCGAGWLSRHLQCLATFFDPYRGREIWAFVRVLAVRSHPGRVSYFPLRSGWFGFVRGFGFVLGRVRLFG